MIDYTKQASIDVITNSGEEMWRPRKNLVWVSQQYLNSKNGFIVESATTTETTKTTETTVPPQHVTAIYATESPYKTSDGQIVSLISVDFTPAADDDKFAGIQVWFTGYHGSSNPQLMAQANGSPMSFLTETTHERVTVTVLSYGKDGLTADFATAPTTTLNLDGVTSPPPQPSIAQNRVALPNNVGWQFQFNVLGGILQDVIDGYWVYHSTSNTTPNPPDGRYKYCKQPSTNIGVITVQEITSDTNYYWLSAVNKGGLESPLLPVQAAATGGITSNHYPTLTANGGNGLISITPTTAYVFTPSAAGNNTGVFSRTSVASPMKTITGFNQLRFNSQGSTARPVSATNLDAGGYYLNTVPLQTPNTGGSSNDFDAIFQGSFVVTQVGSITFNFSCDDGFFMGIGGGATRVSGDLSGCPSNTPTNNYPVVGGYNVRAGKNGGSITVNFPSAGIYPFEVCWTDSGWGAIYLQITA